MELGITSLNCREHQGQLRRLPPRNIPPNSRPFPPGPLTLPPSKLNYLTLSTTDVDRFAGKRWNSWRRKNQGICIHRKKMHFLITRRCDKPMMLCSMFPSPGLNKMAKTLQRRCKKKRNPAR